jgi:hypothetical protein
VTPDSSLLREAKVLGWRITRGSRHWKLFYPATKDTTVLSFGWSSVRSERNQRARLKAVLRGQ